MRKPHLLLVFTCVLLLAISACSTVSPTEALQGEEFQSLVANTLTAVAEQAIQTQLAIPTSTPTEAPTATTAPTATATEVVITLTFTENTNCRKGPATIFPVMATLLSGSGGEVLGIDALGEWFYVHSTEADINCWIWNANTTVSGDTAALPVFTPQPTPFPTRTPTQLPIPIFTVAFVGLTDCPGGTYAANIQVVNTGRITLESIYIRSKVQTIDPFFEHESDGFKLYSGGAMVLSHGELATGESAVVSTCNPGGITINPTNLKIESAITICSQNSLKGECVTQKIVYTPH